MKSTNQILIATLGLTISAISAFGSPETTIRTATGGGSFIEEHFEATHPAEPAYKSLSAKETAARGGAYQTSSTFQGGYATLNHDGLAYVNLSTDLEEAAQIHANTIARGYVHSTGTMSNNPAGCSLAQLVAILETR